MKVKAAQKMKKLIFRRYVELANRGTIWVAIPTLVVLKMLEPLVRMVLSLMECGVYLAIHVPSFSLPTAGRLTRQVAVGD
jgi:hypothetical protein